MPQNPEPVGRTCFQFWRWLGLILYRDLNGLGFRLQGSVLRTLQGLRLKDFILQGFGACGLEFKVTEDCGADAWYLEGSWESH